MILYSNFPLERFLETKLWKKNNSDLGNALFHGNLAILRSDCRNENRRMRDSEKLNTFLGTDVQWFGYEVVPTLNEKLTVLFLMIYRFLHQGMHMVLYSRALMEHLDPETRISTIDVSEKGSGETPMHTYGRFTEDTLYHFINSGRHTPFHDTGLFDRIGMDERVCEYPRIGYIPREEVTVADLLRYAGNFPTMVTIHNYAQCMDAAASVPPDVDNASFRYRSTFPRTLEAVISPKLREEWIDGGFTRIPISVDGSRYVDYPVRLYSMCCTPTQSSLCYIGIGDVIVGYDQICLALMIDVGAD